MVNAKLLTHPNIPKPLHGTNPRSIMGKEWWNIERRKAYSRGNYHCMACGCHKSQDKYHNWLEAHESYDINYKTGKVKLNEIVALCHTCHSFIHSGRLWALYKSGEVSKDKALHILNRGFYILKSNGLEPFWGTAEVFAQIIGRVELIERVDQLRSKQGVKIQQDWSKWHIEIDGVNHYGKFKSALEWSRCYG